MKKIYFLGAALIASFMSFAQSSIDFDGSGTSSITPDSTKFSISNKTGYSFTMWAKGDWSQGNNYLFDVADANGYNNGSDAFRFGMYEFGNNFGMTVFFNGQNTACNTNANNVPINEWFHAAGTIERTNQQGNRATYRLTLYINGDQVRQVNMNINNANGTSLNLSSSSPMRFGSRHAPLGQPTNLAGALDNIVFFDRTLSANEVKDMVCNGTVPTNGRTLYYNCNSGSGSTVFDLSGNSINSTMNRGASWGTEHTNPLSSTPVARFNYGTNSPSLRVNFRDSSTAAASYAWDFGDGNTSNMRNPQHDYAKQGTYQVGLTTTDVCGKTSTKQVNPVVVVCPPAQASFVNVSTDKKVDFEADANGVDNFTWNFGDGSNEVSGNDKNQVSKIYKDYGTYTVCLYVESVCGRDTLCEEITINATGIASVDLQNVQWSVYPNPAKEFVNIKTPAEAGVFNVNLTDLSGRLLETSTQSGGQEIQMGTSNLESGIYVIELENDQYQVSKRIVIE